MALGATPFKGSAVAPNIAPSCPRMSKVFIDVYRNMIKDNYMILGKKKAVLGRL